MSKIKKKKTNALRKLELLGISYDLYEYEFEDKHIDGSTVANMIGKDPSEVFKTLVTKADKNYFVYVIPVNTVLNLKKAAKAAGVKRVEMIPLKELLPATGYLHGGCSPLGMKKEFKKFIHEEVILFNSIIFSAGLRGLQVEIETKYISDLNLEVADLV